MDNATEINAELGETVLAQIPAFSKSRNPDVLPDLARHGSEHTVEILRLLGGGPVGDFEFVREHARRRAEQRFPLEATLHSYRCGHKVFSHWVREASCRCCCGFHDRIHRCDQYDRRQLLCVPNTFTG